MTQSRRIRWSGKPASALYCWAVRYLSLSLGLALACALHPLPARAQRVVDLQIGGWAIPGPNPTLYSAALGRSLWGPLGYTVQGLALVDPDSSERSLYGLGPQLSLFRGSRTLSPYILAGSALAFQPNTSPNVAALWNAGLGLEWNPLGWLGLAAEVNYLAEDRDLRGFWRLTEEDRRGWTYSARVAFRWGGMATTGGETMERFSEATLYGYNQGPSPPTDAPAGDVAMLAGRIVDTAISAMGEPYRWGGTSTDRGFDCSGLVWYAYTSQGVNLPRTSRDQARSGRPVEPDVAALAAGDILTFAESGDAVSHVGLYIGDGRFIHSTNSGGVRVGRLSAGGDADDRWWRDRWVGARRILP